MTLEAALVELLAYWDSRRVLTVHEIGNLHVTLQVRNAVVSFEITDPVLLQDLRGPPGPTVILTEVARAMAMAPEDAQRVLNEARAHLRVDTFQMPLDPGAWKPDATLDPDQVLPAGAIRLLGEILREEAEEVSALKRPMVRRSEDGLRAIVRTAEQQGITLAEASRRSGVPRSTLRDARARMRREVAAPAPVTPGRAPGQRLTVEALQKVLVSQVRGKSAAQVGRDLGLPARTVRDVWERARRAPAGREEAPSGRAPPRQWTSQDRERFLSRVREGAVPTVAGREMGVPGRTAREWARAFKLGKSG